MIQPKTERFAVSLESEPCLIGSSFLGNNSTREGWVGTKYGVVLAFVRFEGKKETVLRFTVGGEMHQWTYPNAYKDTYVGRLAAGMARALSVAFGEV